MNENCLKSGLLCFTFVGPSIIVIIDYLKSKGYISNLVRFTRKRSKVYLIWDEGMKQCP